MSDGTYVVNHVSDTSLLDNSHQLFGSCLNFCLPLHPLVAHINYIPLCCADWGVGMIVKNFSHVQTIITNNALERHELPFPSH